MRSCLIDSFMVEIMADIWVTTVDRAEMSVATVLLGDAVLLIADWTDVASWAVRAIML